MLGTPLEALLIDPFKYMDIVQDDDDDDAEESEEEEEEEEEETEDGHGEDDEEKEGADNESVEDDVGITRRKTDEPNTNERSSQSRSTVDNLHFPETTSTPINTFDPENGSHLRSLDELTQKVESLNLSDIKTRVTSDLSKTRSYQQRKYHSKRSTRQVGRPQGSKAKQDKKVRLDRSGIWH